jgi:hypothetical protein
MKSKVVNVNQSRLLDTSQKGEVVAPQFEPGTDAYAVHSLHPGEIGPHTNVAERAERLIGIMNKLAHRNMLGGFKVAVFDKEYRDDIWKHYLYRTPIVIKHAMPKVDRLHLEAQEEFMQATDFELLRGRGGQLHLGQNEVRTRMDKMWERFQDKVGSPNDHDELVKLRRTQEKFLPMDHPLREENRLAKYKKKKQKQADQEAA